MKHTNKNRKSSRNKTIKKYQKLAIIPEDSKEITAIIDSKAIKHNLDYLRKKTGTPVMPVLKANAYGHGLLGIAKICRDSGVDYIGVATIGEALAIRNGGDTGKILAWLYNIDNPELKTAIEKNIDIGIFDETHIKRIAAMVPSNMRCKVHIHVRTILNSE